MRPWSDVPPYAGAPKKEGKVRHEAALLFCHRLSTLRPADKQKRAIPKGHIWGLGYLYHNGPDKEETFRALPCLVLACCS